MARTIVDDVESYGLEWPSSSPDAGWLALGLVNAAPWRGFPAGQLTIARVEEIRGPSRVEGRAFRLARLVGRRWDEMLDSEGRWRRVGGLFTLGDFAALGIPESAVLVKLFTEKRAFIVPDHFVLTAPEPVELGEAEGRALEEIARQYHRRRGSPAFLRAVDPSPPGPIAATAEARDNGHRFQGHVQAIPGEPTEHLEVCRDCGMERPGSDVDIPACPPEAPAPSWRDRPPLL